MIKNRKNVEVSLYLPKFEINFETELKTSLISMGMIDAFNDNADFLKMIKNNNNVDKVKIDCFIHKTFIKVDEGGTEAAAVSKIKMEFQPKIAIPKKKEKIIIIMNVDHPFLFIIRDSSLPSGHYILFFSKIESI